MSIKKKKCQSRFDELACGTDHTSSQVKKQKTNNKQNEKTATFTSPFLREEFNAPEPSGDATDFRLAPKDGHRIVRKYFKKKHVSTHSSQMHR